MYVLKNRWKGYGAGVVGVARGIDVVGGIDGRLASSLQARMRIDCRISLGSVRKVVW